MPELPIRLPLPVPPSSAPAASWQRHLLGYGLLGATSCVILVEPAPYDLLGLLLLAAAFLGRQGGPLMQPADRLAQQAVLLLGAFLLLQFPTALLAARDAAGSAFYATVTAFLMLLGIHLGSLHGRGDPRFSAFLAGYGLAAAASAALAVASTRPAVAALLPPEWLFAGRPKALFKDPNVLGPYLVPAVLLFLVLAGSARRAARLAWLALALVCAAGVVVTASRAAWINLAIALALFLLFAPARHRRLVLGAAMAATVLALLALPWLQRDDAASGLLELFRQRTELQAYDADRFSVGAAALDIGLARPSGVGPGQITTVGQVIGPGMDPHNTYVRIFAENGGAAMAAFAFALAWIGARAVRELARSGPADAGFVALFAVLAGQLANAAVVDALHWRHFWVVVAVCAFARNRGVSRPGRRRPC